VELFIDYLVEYNSADVNKIVQNVFKNIEQKQ